MTDTEMNTEMNTDTIEEETEMSNVEEQTVHDSLLEVAKNYTPTDGKKFRQQATNEDDTKYITRLVARVAEVPQESFDALPAAAQEWFNAAAGALNEEQPVPELPGFVSRKGMIAPATTRVAKAPEAPKVRKPSAGRAIRTALINDQSLTAAQLIEKLRAEGFEKISELTVSAYHTDTLATLRVAASMGKFVLNPQVVTEIEATAAT